MRLLYINGQAADGVISGIFHECIILVFALGVVADADVGGTAVEIVEGEEGCPGFP